METIYFREDGSQYGDDIEKTDIFCPNCGKQNIWVAVGEGDYYEGPTHYCLDCRYHFGLLGYGVDDKVIIK